MEPYRIVRSEAELEAVATDSLVCPAYYLGSIYEKSAPNEWVEPGSEETIPTAAVWEVMTGSYDGLVMDEDREVWVLIDADAPKLIRPPRSEKSPDYATRVQLRTAEFMTHHTLAEAQKAIEDATGDGVTVGHTNIWKRPRDSYEYRSIVHIKAGTAAADFPWKSNSFATM
ncbi:hypothetical protein Achl_4092 (plasmid) [Pseudarthrobacter chlorophenolicus A6]|uniref:Uncharacterized protein n=1 Tax=Pseudarthrobacter chlorophenolicus (strain ATCC 700700 / DSM 12829 / CIP 107037 / JCM 12360 / KCTC 9906 / NCIMB 13794 / A6) TaxID=452863 RepID=B8HHZ6_PSECP|nr:hypothetical protein [Pseudarthrobacter chlorophenolicus]ACL42043.1 hypothetical protein Achl_4092 [Pseudarthrobacter chlorophenolicus A6]SDQ20751.1 hypothetical protein SAMN04489738_0742 [Pseudarthrobacter chlorophenolicus]